MTKIKIEKVSVRTTKKDGTALLTKKGDPYFNVGIKAEGYEKWMSGFVFQKPTWQTGDEIEVEIEENGQYLNFRLPKKSAVDTSHIDQKLDLLIDMVKTLIARAEVADKEINVDDDLTPDNVF